MQAVTMGLALLVLLTAGIAAQPRTDTRVIEAIGWYPGTAGRVDDAEIRLPDDRANELIGNRPRLRLVAGIAEPPTRPRPRHPHPARTSPLVAAASMRARARASSTRPAVPVYQPMASMTRLSVRGCAAAPAASSTSIARPVVTTCICTLWRQCGRPSAVGAGANR